MKLNRHSSYSALILAALMFTGCASSSKSVSKEVSVEPGTIENAANPNLPAVLSLNEKLAPSDDEIVIYYVRPDKSYDEWSLWTWAVPGGDGNNMWKYSQKWSVEDGIAYMRFKTDGSSSGGFKPASEEGKIGLIVRKNEAWVKDGEDDRIFDINVCKSIVIYSNDQNTYAVQPYEPKFDSAVLSKQNQITLKFSGRYGLDKDGGASGFSVKDSSGKEYVIADVINADSQSHEFNYAKRAIVTLGENVPLSKTLYIDNPVFESKAQVDNTALAIEMSEKTVPSADVELGAVYSDKSVTVRLWAPTSSKVSVNFYKKDRAKSPDYTQEMSFDEKTGLWQTTFNKVDPDGFFYDFTVTNTKGSRTCLDPYAKSMAAYRNDGSTGRGAVINFKSAKANPAGGMTAPYVKLTNREDAVIYEISVRDFTISPDANVKAAPGTYAAFVEKIPYLKSLGITHVQLMPVVNFYYGDETNRKYEAGGNTNGNNYNWGYDPHNYFTPEGWYSTDAADPYKRISELKNLINECHKSGIGVILDVVYNHMAGTQFLDDIVPGYYFRRNVKGGFTSASGCGNDTATERLMMKRLVDDSIEYWVKEYKVDGFRFDLAGLMESSSVIDGYKRAAAINPDTLFIGEGWKMYNGPRETVGLTQDYMTKTNAVAVFNDEFRDAIKSGGFNETGTGFITGRCSSPARLFSNICAVPKVNYKADDPQDSVQYLACHDGLTLHDVIANNMKLSDSDPVQKEEIIARLKLGNFILFTSQGIPFLHGGQERGRTKPNVSKQKNETIGNFVRNSYDSTDTINQFVWKLDKDYEGLLKYTQDMIALRKNTAAFRLTEANTIASSVTRLATDENNWLLMAYTIKQGSEVYIVCINASKESATVPVAGNFAKLTVLADKNGASLQGISSPQGLVLEGSNIVLNPLTAAVIKAE